MFLVSWSWFDINTDNQQRWYCPRSVMTVLFIVGSFLFALLTWYYMNDVIQRRWGSLRCTITLLCTIGSLSPAFWSWVSWNDDIKELWQCLEFTIAVLSTIWFISLRSWNGYRKSWRELLWKVVICFQKMTYCFSICLIWEKRFYWF